MANAPYNVYAYIWSQMCFSKTSAVAGSLDNLYIPKDIEMPVNYRFIKTINPTTGTAQNVPLTMKVDAPFTQQFTVGGVLMDIQMAKVYDTVNDRWLQVRSDFRNYWPENQDPENPKYSNWELMWAKKDKPIIVVDMYDSQKNSEGLSVEYFPRLALDGFRAMPQKVKGASCWEVSQYFDLYDSSISQINPRAELGAIKDIFEYYVFKLKTIEPYFKTKNITLYDVQLEEYLIRSATEAFFTDRNYQGSNGDGDKGDEGVITASLHYTFKMREDDSPMNIG